MRISDWSSDVCSSDLYDVIAERYGTDEMRRFFAVQMEAIDLVKETCVSRGIEADITGGGEILLAHRPGRAKALRDERREMYEMVGLDCSFLDEIGRAHV